jgi:hypothetical protein
VERVTGIEPAYFAWEANVLPLNYTRLQRCACKMSGGNEPDTENTIQPAIIFNLKLHLSGGALELQRHRFY